MPKRGSAMRSAPTTTGELVVLTVAEVEALARVGVSEDVLNEGGTMNEEYTPPTSEVRRAYTLGMRQAFVASAGEHNREFDRWLAEVERAAAEKAWHEGFCRGEVSGGREWPINPHAENPYRRGGSDE